MTRNDRGQLTPGTPPYTGVTNLQQQEDFTYDETGNWKGYESLVPSLDQTREHNTANQIAEIANPSGVVQPAYDPAGNMRTMPAPGDWTKAYTCKWDAWNRLVEIKDGGALVQANTYDAHTRRIRKDNGSETRDYYYNRQWRALEERVAGTVKADYVYSPTDRWNLIRRRRSVSGTLDETRFVLRDYLDPVAIVTTAGAVDERYGYDAFGPVRKMSANFGTSTSTAEWNWLFHGEFLDEESGVYNYGYRYYHPQLGRWTSRDPLGERGGINLYAFLFNSTQVRIDRLGLICKCTFGCDFDVVTRSGTKILMTIPERAVGFGEDEDLEVAKKLAIADGTKKCIDTIVDLVKEYAKAPSIGNITWVERVEWDKEPSCDENDDDELEKLKPAPNKPWNKPPVLPEQEYKPDLPEDLDSDPRPPAPIDPPPYVPA